MPHEPRVEEVLARTEQQRRWLAQSGGLAVRQRTHIRLRVETILKDRVPAAAGVSVGLDPKSSGVWPSGSIPTRWRLSCWRGLYGHGLRRSGRPTTPAATPLSGDHDSQSCNVARALLRLGEPSRV